MISILKQFRRRARPFPPPIPVEEVAAPPIPTLPAPPEPAGPTVFHITHYKAGSQWVNKILHALVYDRLVTPDNDLLHFFDQPIRPGKVYPTLYVTKDQFDFVGVPADHRRFVVIRDLRDTLISLYFSVLVSHEVTDAQFAKGRTALQKAKFEQGLLYVIETTLGASALIQHTWQEAGEPLIRYEDLLTDDVEILERVLIDQCELPVTRERLREVVHANRFEQLTRGRQRGEEDVKAHERKGISGDWRNHFTPTVKEFFKQMYGHVLIATGYEKDNDW